jgi:catechol 2,3-dioxygenase-like lactoylglutathione lyase family enzyme
MQLAALALASLAWQSDGLDHIMLWTDSIDRTTAVFTVKLGFQVRPGGDFGDGVANRLLRIGDESYIELLYTTRARAELNESTRKDLDALRTGTGARTFAVHPLELDQLDALLRKRGFELDPPSPLTYDPDGAGPLAAMPSEWRTVSFAKPPITSGDLFFIGYAQEHPTPLQLEDRALTREHLNGARAWTSIWLLSSDVAADRKALGKMGFTDGGEVNLPQVGAHGALLQSGPDTIVLLAPQGDGIAARALASRGTHVLGLSIGVKDINRAQRLVQRGYGIKLDHYAGLEGDSILAPTYEDLGLLIEFHAMPMR